MGCIVLACPKCDAHKVSGAMFCPSCGRRLNVSFHRVTGAPSPILPTDEEPAAKKRMKILMALTAIALTVTLIVASLAVVEGEQSRTAANDEAKSNVVVPQNTTRNVTNLIIGAMCGLFDIGSLRTPQWHF